MKQSKHPRTDAFFASNKGPAETYSDFVVRVSDLVRMCQEFEDGSNRYEKVRALTPEQFNKLWMRNLHDRIPFDELVDGLE